ncbi:MAG: FAD:protein FMN transferase [Alphaproteobacteria bacterium]
MSWTRREVIRAAGTAAVAMMAPTIGRAAEASAAGRAMGTSWHAVVPNGSAQDCVAVIGDLFARIEAIFSPYLGVSELSRLNAYRGRDGVPVSSDMATVIAEGQRIATQTRDAFNPAVGGVVRRYGFGPITDTGHTDHTDLVIHGGLARKLDPDVTFDPCGIAKGYALDLAAAKLASVGLKGFLIELGGEIRAEGCHPSGRAWQAGIETPGAADTTLQRLVRLGGNAVATSSSAVNAYRIAGRRYHHVIDPRTSQPVANDVASVSVIAPSAMTADALATGLMVMGPEAGMALAEREGIAVLFLVRDGTALREVTSRSFAPHIVV